MGIRPVRGAERSDAAVIAASLGDPQTFAVLFDRHFDAVFGYLARRIGVDRAEDVAAATFAVAFERRGTFRDRETARPWLFGIATNLMHNDRRAQQRALSALAELIAGGAGIAAQGPRPGESVVAEALARLDPDQRDVVVLHAWEGFSYREIASALGVPVGTVRSRLSRARAQLRLLLGDQQPARRSRSSEREVTE